MSSKVLTIDEYAALVGQLNAKIATQQQENDKQATNIKTLEKSVTNLTNQIETLTEVKNGLESELQTSKTGAGEIIRDLKLKLDSATQIAEAATADETLIPYGKKFYKSHLVRFHHDGVLYQASQLKENPALVKQLIEERLGVLYEVVKK